MNPTSGMIRGTSRDRYSREPSSRAFTAGRKPCPSSERPVVEGDQRLAGDQRVCSGPGLPQGHHRQQAHDAGEDGGGLQDPGADEAQRDRLRSAA